MISFLKNRKVILFILTLYVICIPLVVFAAPANQGYVPLSNVPGFPAAGNAPDLSAFLKTIYKICVGAGAVLATLQIVRGGVMWMSTDNIQGKKEGRHIIVMALVGLILVLSPVIVFNLIDPRILNLQINAEPLELKKQGD